jgi:hypothetical protein
MPVETLQAPVKTPETMLAESQARVATHHEQMLARHAIERAMGANLTIQEIQERLGRITISRPTE